MNYTHAEAGLVTLLWYIQNGILYTNTRLLWFKNIEWAVYIF